MRRLAALLSALLLGGAARAGESAPQPRFGPEALRAAVESHVRERSAGGVFGLAGPKAGERLELEFVRVGVVGAEGLWHVHAPGRKSEGRGWWACAFFHTRGAPPQQLWDVDFHIVDRGGKLEIDDALLHRERRLVDSKWAWSASLLRRERVGR
ncbi:MAG TPA: hypothetical protein VH880_00715 [Anaeromyxobacteraceae bacterium]|jgi:hypothetical protein